MDDQNLLHLAYKQMVIAPPGFKEDELYLRWDALEQEKSRRLPAEVDAIAALDVEITNVKAKILHLEMVRNGYPEQLSTEVLTWRYKEGKNKGYPAFMVIDLNDSAGVFTLNGNASYWGKASVEVYMRSGTFLEPFYQDLTSILVNQSFWQRFEGEYSLTKISASFAGVLPDDTLTRIQVAKAQNLFESILLIAQVDQWSTETVRVTTDPLIVGLRDGKLFIIDKFDLKPLETYAAEQFAWREG